jgi:hypothetical protein
MTEQDKRNIKTAYRMYTGDDAESSKRFIMQHQRSIDVTKLINAEAALLCSRLYLRAGKRYLQEGLLSAGIAALYDAILFAMHYYIAEPACRGNINVNSDDVWDHAHLYYKLVKAGIFKDPNAFNHLSLTVERALWQESYSFDTNSVLAEVEKMLSKLGVMPFNEYVLQSESIATC